MTIDINVNRLDENFFDDMDDIMEDTMIQMFILHPKDKASLETAQSQAAENSAVFYSVPLELLSEADDNCIGINLNGTSTLASNAIAGKTLFIDEKNLTATMIQALSDKTIKGVILNATNPHPKLEHLYLSIGPDTVKAFDTEALNTLPMDRILLQSGYPDNGFEEIYATVKIISDAMFRPEQSLVARATKHSLQLLGFSKT